MNKKLVIHEENQVTNLKIKKEYQELFPNPTPESYALLKEDIKNNGQKIPIIHNKAGYILDGYTRYNITKELGIKPRTELKEFSDKNEELNFIFSLNFQRRHLSIGQKFFVFKDYEKLIKGNKKSKDSKSKYPDYKLGYEIGISSSSLRDIKFILDNGDEEYINMLKEGVSVYRVYHRVKAIISLYDKHQNIEQISDSEEPSNGKIRDSAIVCIHRWKKAWINKRMCELCKLKQALRWIPEDKNYQCNLCEIKFHLKKELRIHKGEVHRI